MRTLREANQSPEIIGMPGSEDCFLAGDKCSVLLLVPRLKQDFSIFTSYGSSLMLITDPLLCPTMT